MYGCHTVREEDHREGEIQYPHLARKANLGSRAVHGGTTCGHSEHGSARLTTLDGFANYSQAADKTQRVF